jgi:chromosome segregation ATPase
MEKYDPELTKPEYPKSVLNPEVTKVDGAIVAELIAARQMLRQQNERVRNLEEALEETVTSLAAAKSRVAEQAYFEAHLASTEETANVQQQAILQLKHQLSQKHHQLSQKDMAFNQLLQARKSAEQRDQDHLEAEIAKQRQTQALLQQACQELEQDRELQQDRMQQLEQQAAQMQEEILKQAQQSREYQTAIQHLKDYHLHLQAQITELYQTIERSGIELPADVQEILANLQDPIGSVQRGIRPYQDLSVDLPGFLKRWQRREDGA